ncbi:MAG: hydroxymethylbilane synthase [Nitrospirae bacterium]|nr:MAG: hydroxymethylbilane synthase [Nitrospirota bacterium]
MGSKREEVIIGTRGSKLALWQAKWVKSALKELNPNITFKLKTIKTKGDKILDVPLAKIGGKGLFVKDIEDAMITGEIDLAVHSMKDVPMVLPEELHISAICEREEPRDAFISIKYNAFKELAEGATVGTSSLRRASQLLNIRGDLKISQLRGNVDTRIRKLREGLYDAIILAAAGVKRLGLYNIVKELIDTSISLPAVGQGAIGIECRRDDLYINGLTSKLNHIDSAICIRAERAFLRRLEGGCQIPIAAYATISDNLLRLEGLVGTVDGKRIIRDSISGKREHPETLGIELAENLLERGADKILSSIREHQNRPLS